ncbi:hypothetical protein TNCV_348491 [Trichonephila clavipes]|nr:hypothetical protein TNCV_348491 [Trichonephila clavipes]
MEDPGRCRSYFDSPGESHGCCPRSAKPPDITFWVYTATGLAWLLTRSVLSAAKLECMETTYSNAQDSMNTCQLILGGSASNG